MDFRIADTFTDSLARLTAQEQKATKTTAFDLQLDQSASGLSFHKLDRAQDKNFWSLRVNADIRIIVHKTASSILLVYVNHHDDAYRWAERRKIEQHPTTGAMQLVEVRERVEEIATFKPQPVESVPNRPAPKLFDNLRKFELMSFGVPAEWVDEVRAATEDTLFDMLLHLPQEAQECLLKLAVGETPLAPTPKFFLRKPAEPTPPAPDPFSHPDAQRRFLVIKNIDELQRALDYPWEKWSVFLHPDQRQLVERDYSGPARVSGSAGTGKTIVALHRAVHLARKKPAARVLLSTFSRALATALSSKLDVLVGNEPQVAARITVGAITDVARALYAKSFGLPNIASQELIERLLAEAAKATEDGKFTPQFLFGEWNEVVDPWQLQSFEAYRDVPRLGRKTRLGGKQREILWAIFERVRDGLAARNAVTWAGVFSKLAEQSAQGKRPFDFAVIDEAQDIGVAEARFLANLGSGRPDALFFAGDLGQRIFQQPFSWKALGIDVRGRSATLRINYRTSHQIRAHADRLLPAEIADVDGEKEGRKGTVSLFDGPAPRVSVFATQIEKREAVGAWTAEFLGQGLQPHEIGFFVRSEARLPRAQAAAEAAGVAWVELSDQITSETGKIAIGTMYLAKGLEFRAVAVMACDDEVIPSQERVETVGDEADLEEVYNTERHLLYVACTRARDNLLVTGVAPASEFLADLLRGPQRE
ncbi:MAG: UvrD-helicase domain-containing protein [Beijerinckiaceae bacterium]